MSTTDEILEIMLKHIEDNNLDIDPELIKAIHKIVMENSPNSNSILKNEQSMRDMKYYIEQAIEQYIQKSKEEK